LDEEVQKRLNDSLHAWIEEIAEIEAARSKV
jgi:hypothetical protein